MRTLISAQLLSHCPLPVESLIKKHLVTTKKMPPNSVIRTISLGSTTQMKLEKINTMTIY